MKNDTLRLSSDISDDGGEVKKTTTDLRVNYRDPMVSSDRDGTLLLERAFQ